MQLQASSLCLFDAMIDSHVHTPLTHIEPEFQRLQPGHALLPRADAGGRGQDQALPLPLRDRVQPLEERVHRV